MSDNTTFQTESYECSRQNSKVQISNAEWINEFTDGIELKQGDTVRLLGSFVHEGSSGEEIQITKDLTTNISFSPFIKANTFGTADRSNNLIELKNYADIPYTSDAFGIEPPLWYFKETVNAVKDVSHTVENQDMTLFGDPTCTGMQPNYIFNENSVSFGPPGPAPFNSIEEKTFTPGINRDTSQYNNPGADYDQFPGLDYETWSSSSAPNEMYIGHMVKKLILPVFNKIRNCNRKAVDMVGQGPRLNNFDERDIEPLSQNLPAFTPGGAPGMFAGAPRAGMVIATVNLGGASGFVNEKSQCFWQSTNGLAKGDQEYNGQPNTFSGVESVVGTIIASRPIKMNILGAVTDCYEVLVSDFINPAQIQQSMFEFQAAADTFCEGSSYKKTFAEGPPLNTAPAQLLYKFPHGSSNLANGYNFNPIYNNLNGTMNRFQNSPLSHQGLGNVSGQYAMTPLAVWDNIDFSVNLAVGSDAPVGNSMNHQYCQPQGLSFLWCGSHTGGQRYGAANKGGAAETSWFRTNSNILWERTTVGDLAVKICLTDRGVNSTGAGVITNQNINGSTNLTCGNNPVCLGGYIITTPEDMNQIIQGKVATNAANDWYQNGLAGQNARVWLDYSFQAANSKYSTRHYRQNSWDVKTAFPDIGTANPAAYVPIRPLKYDGTPDTGFIQENRWGYEFCAQPLNVNWRSTFKNTAGGGGAAFIANAGRTIEIPEDTNEYPKSHGTVSNDTATEIGEMFPTYYSTPTGKMAKAPPPANAYTGMVLVNGAYQNCVNSIYFQDKMTGDTELGINTTRFETTITIASLAGANNVTIELNPPNAPAINPALLVVGTLISIQKDNVQMRNWLGIVSTAASGGTNQTLFLEANFPLKANTDTGDKIIILVGGGPTSAGVNADPWAGDCIMMKECMTQIKIPAGFYTEQDLGEKINQQIHFTPEEYAANLGVRQADGTFSSPTTVGLGQSARASNPTIVNGNFLQSFLPDINYAFTPVTPDNEEILGLSASTKEFTNLLYTYDPIDDGAGNIVYSWPLDLDAAYQGNDARRLLTETKPNYPTITGRHIKLYSIPHITTSPVFNPQIHLMRLKGGAYLQSDYDATGEEWKLTESRFVGTGEMMRDYLGASVPAAPFRFFNYGTDAVFQWKTRLNRNLFANGGSCKLFLGANNFTFEWQDLIDRFSFNNLYTPFRPHDSENPTKSDFGVDDATPSAVISARSTGQNIGSLSGIYLNSLVADNFTRENWGFVWYDKYLYSTVADTADYDNSKELMNTIGYSDTQLTTFNNQFDFVQTPFVFCTFQRQSGETVNNGLAIRVGAKLDTAINGTNPFANACTLMAPIQQYYVQVLTDDFFADNIPTKGSDPYYFVGSDFPGKRFYGNDTGTRLPVIGICARNFHSFNFAFDLGSSAIQYTIEEDITITSIRTAIYTSNLKIAENLQQYSSVIYIVEKNNFLNPIPDELGKQTQQALINSIPPLQNSWFSQTAANYRSAPPPILPPNYKKSDGTLLEQDDNDDDIDWD